MAKSRRGVKFPHRSGSNSQDGRRSSFSDISEAASEPGSPILKDAKDKLLHVRDLVTIEFRASFADPNF